MPILDILDDPAQGPEGTRGENRYSSATGDLAFAICSVSGMTWRGFKDVAPRGEGFEKEPFSGWFERVRNAIPHVPECVARQWLHENWGGSPYEWLSLSRLRFELERWSNERILAVGQCIEPETTRCWGAELGRSGNHRRQTKLGRYMLENGTWPVPIIVLDNPKGLTDPKGRPLARFHLLEGHMRSAYHYYLAVISGEALPEHEVWVTRIAAHPRADQG